MRITRSILALMQIGSEGHAWPTHDVETLPWRQRARGGTREDRILDSVAASIPPLIARRDYLPPMDVTVETEKALLAVAQADTDAEGRSAALGRFMMRTESAASSKIERISASSSDFARALAGNRSNPSATSMVAAAEALSTLVETVGRKRRFALEDLLVAHAALMADDPREIGYSGRLRDMQNWIGGSDFSPRNALHVPPDPSRVPGLLEDLIIYLNRDDVPVMVQASIAHAQFESIHPFTDGNGRIGRALVAASLRRRGVTRLAVVPLASGLLARREEYFEALGSYRAGEPAPIIGLFARSARAAAECSRESIARLSALPGAWRDELRPRAGSAVDQLIDGFSEHPVMGVEDIEGRTEGSAAQLYRAIDALVEAGVIDEITGRRRNRVWAASEVLAELDELDRRIRLAMRPG